MKDPIIALPLVIPLTLIIDHLHPSPDSFVTRQFDHPSLYSRSSGAQVVDCAARVCAILKVP